MIADRILRFWFNGDPDAFRDVWFKRDDTFDAAIAAQFGTDITAIVDELQAASRLDAAWWLAMVIAHDQFPRNLFRGAPRAFAYDETARLLSDSAIKLGMDQQVTPVQRLFFTLPFTHAESMAEQDRCVGLVTAMVEGRPDLNDCLVSAHKHREVIARFGRFPHRNAALGRLNTPEEEAYLAEPGAGF